MVTVDEVAAWAMALPKVSEGTTYGNPAWSVGGRAFAWQRPFSKADIRRFGDTPPPDGAIVALRVDDLMDKEAVLAAGHPGFFTIQHFDGFAAVLVQLRVARRRAVRDTVVDAWLACAPPPDADDYLAARRRR